MNNVIDRVLAAYRPLYLRGLLMDGQYRLPKPPQAPPTKGSKAIHLTPAFKSGPRRVLVTTTNTPAGLHAFSVTAKSLAERVRRTAASLIHPSRRHAS
ncbi:hypothetical protein GCM10007862_02560 [Dyella lipolytica]|uniref:Transposase n=1 Tax=Dyella lipolytica TaxID=1867835 RepID=A0ABW8IRL0_9GAMM|nr:hypothetical protein [Dyella lipolytica]GLQ45205.1 hypothetical protein GCM10007862_02560 [Dyella lipolytica]